VFEGDEESVARVVEFAHRGPEGAAVQRVEEREEEPEDLTGFQIR
jgi:acylphosphatase